MIPQARFSEEAQNLQKTKFAPSLFSSLLAFH